MKEVERQFKPLLAPKGVQHSINVTTVLAAFPGQRKADNRSVGEAICRFANDKAVAAIVVSSNPTAGRDEHDHVSVARHCTTEASQPVYVIHGSGKEAQKFAAPSRGLHNFLSRVSPSINLMRRSLHRDSAGPTGSGAPLQARAASMPGA